MPERTPGDNTDEIAYALITPYSLHKSRTGGIIARLLWSNVRLVAARMYAPKSGSGLITEYCDAIYDPAGRAVPISYQKLLIQYVLENFDQPNVRGISNRMMLLVFRGPNAQAEVVRAVGHIGEDVRGDDVRGTFGDFVSDNLASPVVHEAARNAAAAMNRYPVLQKIELPDRRNSFFEPAALVGTAAVMTEAHLKLFRRHAYSDGGYVLHALQRPDLEELETSMVILKPESLRRRNPLPGNLIDFFARTGMYITGAKMLQLSVQQASEFYGLKLPQFTRQLKGKVEQKARQIVSQAKQLAQIAVEDLGADPAYALEPRRAMAAARKALDMLYRQQAGRPGEVKGPVVQEICRLLAERLQSLDPSEGFYKELAEDLKDLNARTEFKELIRYMTGRDPDTGLPEQEGAETMCMAVLYSGKNGLRLIRERLKELRVIYGRNILQNRAHASDPEEDPVKEVEVLGMPNAPGGEGRPCDVEQVVNDFYGTA